MKENQIIRSTKVENRIFTIRDKHVMIDRDLADLYDVKTKVLNQAVKRNIERFPESFRFQLTEEEKGELVTSCDRLEPLKHSNEPPYAFTEQGVAMLSAVLRSNVAVQVSIQIMNAFVALRSMINNFSALNNRLQNIEQKQVETDQKFEKVFRALESKPADNEKGIFYDGQIFDAYQLVSDIIRRAEKKIRLIDNYIDDTVLVMLNKRKSGVDAFVYTPRIGKELKLDLKKHNEQYPEIHIHKFKQAHDRFLIIDDKELYHIGASLKDLGKKWFAFSRLQIGLDELLKKLNV